MSNKEFIKNSGEAKAYNSPRSTKVNQPPRKKSGGILIIGAIIVVVIVIIGAVFLSGVIKTASKDYKATIFIHVTSAHIANVVNIDLFADGKSINSYSLDALSTNVYQYDAWLSGSSNDIVISGTGQGGALGDTSSSSTITVSDGGTYNVYMAL